jgi:hypothetical protein
MTDHPGRADAATMKSTHTAANSCPAAEAETHPGPLMASWPDAEARRTPSRQPTEGDRMSRIALALLYPARLLAQITEQPPPPGGRPSALYLYSNQ